MKKRFIISYAIFATCFILLSLTFLGYNLFKEYKEGESRTRSIFANTVYNLYSDLADTYDSGSEFYQNISSAAGSLQNYSFYEIQKNNKIIYSYPANTTKEDTTSNLTKNFSTNINIENNNYLITCNIYLLKPYSIYHYSRITFLLILGLTLLTIILILFSNKKSEPKKTSKKNVIENFTNEDIKIDDDFDIPAENNEDLNFDIEELEPLDISNEDNLNSESSDISNDNKEPEGLFSTSTGFGWESYLITRLNNEINRAIASEMDISLFIIKLANLPRTNPLTREICDYIASQFQFRDLLFEYKDDCLVAIKNGDNLDEALDFAEKLYTEISKKLIETKYKCYIGITTRSVRMISAERFINEAEQALNHAEESKNDPIIAFKADIEKYRKYVEQKFDE